MAKKQMNENMDVQDFPEDHCGDECVCAAGYDDCGGCGSCYNTSSSLTSRILQGLLTLAGIVFLVLLSVGLWQQVFGNGWFKNIKAEITSQPFARTITVNGEGKVTVKPDLAQVSLSVVSNGATVKEVTEDNNKKMAQIVEAVKALKIDSKDITTSEYNLYPNYNYPVYSPNTTQPQTPKITGYSLNQTVMVKVRNLDDSDKVLDVALAKGANQISALTFDVEDPSKLKAEAREKAFSVAKEKADDMAKAVGVKIGRVITFSEGSNGYPVPMANFSMKSMSPEAQSSDASAVEPGSKEYNINVSVTYEIE